MCASMGRLGEAVGLKPTTPGGRCEAWAWGGAPGGSAGGGIIAEPSPTIIPRPRDSMVGAEDEEEEATDEGDGGWRCEDDTAREADTDERSSAAAARERGTEEAEAEDVDDAVGRVDGNGGARRRRAAPAASAVMKSKQQSACPFLGKARGKEANGRGRTLNEFVFLLFEKRPRIGFEGAVERGSGGLRMDMEAAD